MDLDAELQGAKEELEAIKRAAGRSAPATLTPSAGGSAPGAPGSSSASLPPRVSGAPRPTDAIQQVSSATLPQRRPAQLKAHGKGASSSRLSGERPAAASPPAADASRLEEAAFLPSLVSSQLQDALAAAAGGPEEAAAHAIGSSALADLLAFGGNDSAGRYMDDDGLLSELSADGMGACSDDEPATQQPATQHSISVAGTPAAAASGDADARIRALEEALQDELAGTPGRSRYTAFKTPHLPAALRQRIASADAPADAAGSPNSASLAVAELTPPGAGAAACSIPATAVDGAVAIALSGAGGDAALQQAHAEALQRALERNRAAQAVLTGALRDVDSAIARNERLAAGLKAVTTRSAAAGATYAAALQLARMFTASSADRASGASVSTAAPSAEELAGPPPENAPEVATLSTAAAATPFGLSRAWNVRGEVPTMSAETRDALEVRRCGATMHARLAGPDCFAHKVPCQSRGQPCCQPLHVSAPQLSLPTSASPTC